jgi:2-dehydropantoate 2-reductase
VRYVVLGSGAIGGTVAAGLARDGHQVVVVDTDSRVVEAVNERGLRITGPVEEFTAHPTAIGPADLPATLDGPVLVAVKAHHTAAAAASLAGRLAGDGYVVSLQNGLNTTVLQDAVGAGRVVEACVNFGADVIEPGVVLRGNRATFKVGETDGTITDRVRALASDIADAEVTGNVLGYIWAKEAYGAMLAAGAVSDLPIADTLDDPAYRTLMIEIARQVLALAPVKPLLLDGFDPDDLDGSLDRLADFNRRSAKSHSGIYRDLAVLHRPTEVGAILSGLISPDTPLIRATLELIAAIERGERHCEQANLDLLAAYERLDRLGRPLNAVAAVIGAPARAAGGALAGEPVAVTDIVAIAGVAMPGIRGRVRASADRRHPQPARSVQDLGRFIRRVGRAGRGRSLRSGHRYRYRRIDQDSGRLLRHRRPEAKLRPGPGRWHLPVVTALRPRGHPDGDRRRGGEAARGARRRAAGERAGRRRPALLHSRRARLPAGRLIGHSGSKGSHQGRAGGPGQGRLGAARADRLLA